jgi:5-formyltetrahydrofolate cyclo-ligase
MLEENKKKIRKDILSLRNALPKNELEAMSRNICRRFTGLPVVKDCSSVMIFLSFGSEINTDYLIEWLWQQGKRVLVPLCKPETREMDIIPITTFHDVEPGYFGIREPKRGLRPPVAREAIDLVVVPGGGYYDRFLAGMDVPRIGLAFSCQIIPEAPVDKYDLAVQGIVTEKEYISVASFPRLQER